MPIDPKQGARPRSSPPAKSAYGQDQVILYHLGHRRRRAGHRPEASSSTPTRRTSRCCRASRVIPTFGAMGGDRRRARAAVQLRAAAARRAGRRDPPADPGRGQARDAARAIAGIYDKGKAALVVRRGRRRRTRAAQPLFTNRFSLFLRGEGGFGGDSRPEGRQRGARRARPTAWSSRRRCRSRRCSTGSSGDKNPLHADPDFAKMGGFDKPILHGLCSFGIVCKAVVDHALDGDVDEGRALPGALRGRRSSRARRWSRRSGARGTSS